MSIPDVLELVEASALATIDPTWRDRHERSAFMLAVRDALQARRDEVVATAAGETGYPAERVDGEFTRTLYQLELFAKEAASGEYLGAVVSPASDSGIVHPELRRMKVAIGPVAVFAASNLPLAFGVIGGDTAAAWAAGCPVIAKSHPAQPLTSALQAGIVDDVVATSDLPLGVFSHLASSDVAVAQQLVAAPGLAAVAFTGSLRAGRAIFDAAAARTRPIPVFAEMGSANPMLITPAALTHRASEIAAGLVDSALAVSGQLCTKPGVVYVPTGADGDAFVRTFVDGIESRAVGPMLTSGHRTLFARSLETLDSNPAVAMVASGTTLDDDERSAAPVVYQTSMAAALEDPDLLQEHFGPAVVLLRYEAIDEAVDALVAQGGQLTITIHAEDADESILASSLPRLEALVGRLVWNGFPTGVAVDDGMVHGGPYPATTAPAFSAVGRHSVARFLRPVAFQNSPEWALPADLKS